MRDTTITKRKAVPRRYNPTDLEGRMQGAAAAGGGIQAGAHPEFNAPTPLDRLVAVVKKTVQWGRGLMRRR
jgi:hypothetical protein